MARKMKDSGIEWIGEIPEGWEIAKAKYFIDISHGSDPKTQGFIPVYGSGSESFKTCGEYKEGPAVLIGRKGATLHIPHYIEGKYWNVDTAFDVKSKSHCILKFYYYLAACFDYKYYISQTTLPGMTQSNYYNMFLPVPSLSKQFQIATYLDAHGAAFDFLISKVRSSIEEYKKLKQAVITQAVTKGVRGKREMKDSGVEWIGEIPKEFDSVQLKFFCKLITDGTHFSPNTVETGLPYITAGDVHGIGLDYNSAKRISEEDFQLLVAQGCQPLKGDVLLVKDGATTGRVGFVDSDTPCVILSSVAMLRPADKTDGHYLMYLLASDFLQKQILVSMAGSAMPRTTLTKLTKYIGLLPPLYEQKEIADYLDAKCAEIDGLIAKKEQLVKELESYKKSLIYEVVTGKREV